MSQTRKKNSGSFNISKKASKLILIAILILLLVFWGVKSFFHPSSQPQFPPPLVSIQKISRIDQELDLVYVGKTAGYRDVDIHSQVTGILHKVLYQEGELIKKGRPIFVIDPLPFQQNLKKAQSGLKEAQQGLQYAKNNWNRAQELFPHKAISKEEYERTQSRHQSALSAKENALANLKIAEKELSYAEIRSPITGIIGEKQHSEGNLITANSSSALTKILQIDPLYVYFAYSDKDMALLREMKNKGIISTPKNFKVDIILENGDKFAHQGKIDFIDSKVDHNTSSVELRAVLPNGKGDLLPGEFVKVVVRDVIWKGAIIVPDSAVIQSAQGAMLYVVDDHEMASIRPVKIGPLTQSGRIITSGLKEDERIIIGGLIKVRPGGKVTDESKIQSPSH